MEGLGEVGKLEHADYTSLYVRISSSWNLEIKSEIRIRWESTVKSSGVINGPQQQRYRTFLLIEVNPIGQGAFFEWNETMTF